MPVLNAAKKRMVDVFTAEPIKAMLLTSTHVTNIDTQQFLSDVDANEVTGTTNYTVGGFTLAGVASTRDDTTDKVKLTFTDYVANNLTATFRSVAFFNWSGDRLTSKLIGIATYGADQVYSNDNLTIQCPADGLLSQEEIAA